VFSNMISRPGKGFWETVHNIGWMGAGRIVRMGGALVVGVMVVRYLGPTQFGAFSYALALYGLFNIISNLGLDYLVVSEVALSTGVKTEEEILGTAFMLKVAASIVTTLSAVGYAWITRPNDTIIIAIVAMLSVASIAQGFDVVDYFFQAKTLSRLTVIPQLIVFLLTIATRALAVVLKCSLLTFGVIAALEIVATEIAFAYIYFHHYRNIIRWTFNSRRALSLLKASWPLTIAGLLITIYMRTDQILLGTLSTKAVVGQYSAAVKLSEIWYSIPMIISASVMPRLLKHKEERPGMYYSRLARLYQYMAALSIVLALSVSLFGKYIILLFFGAAYMPAINILAVHIWTGPFVFLGVISGQQLIHEKLTQITLQRSLVGAIANVGLNLLLIPRYGGIGSAVATLVAQILASYLMDAFNKSTRDIFQMKTRALLGIGLFSARSVT
jgi:polysaccharide transporter, PST family